MARNPKSTNRVTIDADFADLGPATPTYSVDLSKPLPPMLGSEMKRPKKRDIGEALKADEGGWYFG